MKEELKHDVKFVRNGFTYSRDIYRIYIHYIVVGSLGKVILNTVNHVYISEEIGCGKYHEIEKSYEPYAICIHSYTHEEYDKEPGGAGSMEYCTTGSEATDFFHRALKEGNSNIIWNELERVYGEVFGGNNTVNNEEETQVYMMEHVEVEL